MKLDFRARAEVDILDAWNYYEGKQEGLGTRFLSHLNKMLQKVAANPQHYSFIDKTQTIRDASLRPFPYVIVFKVVGDAVVVLRVFNTARNPESL